MSCTCELNGNTCIYPHQDINCRFCEVYSATGISKRIKVEEEIKKGNLKYGKKDK